MLSLFLYVEGNMKKVIIAGSRSFYDYTLLKTELDKLFAEPFIVVSGGAKGADSLGEIYAQEKGYPIERYLAKWNDLSVKNCVIKHNSYGAYNAMAGHNRNQEMLNAILKNLDGGCVVAFWDGKSKGTENMINISRKAGIFVKIVKI